MRAMHCRLALVLVLFALLGCSQETRILVAGDSWAYCMELFKTWENPIAYQVVYLNSTSLETAHGWNTDWKKAAVSTFLEENPDVDIVVLSLGGNDLLIHGDVRDTEEQRAALVGDIGQDLEDVIEDLLSVRSEIRVALTGYDYTNWEESMEWPFSRDWYLYWYEHLGAPTSPIEMNSYLQLLASEQWRIGEELDRVAFVNNYGLMQWKYGIPRYGIPAESLPHPGYSSEGPLFGGDASYYSPPAGMLGLPLLHCDPIHLSPGGYLEVTRNAMDRCVRDWLGLSLPSGFGIVPTSGG